MLRSSHERRRPDAVLVVHGIGEQISNDTARSLADALADPDADRVRSAAGPGADGTRLRVYSIVWDASNTARSPESHITEGYWAYRFRDTAWSHITGWLLPLVRSVRDHAPERLMLAEGWLRNLWLAVAVLAGLITVAGRWADGALGSWFAEMGFTAAVVVLVTTGVVGAFVLLPHRLPSKRTSMTAAGAVTVIALLDPFFGWLMRWPPPQWLTTGAVIVLVVVVLASLAVDVVTSVQVLSVATVTITLTLIGAATNQDDASSTVLALLASAAVPWASAAAAAALLPALGDAARYFRDHPSNEDDSRHIRKIVIDKLDELHRLDDGEPRFERVVVIGHSLGSVIAYDAINHYWAETTKSLTVGGPRDCGTCSKRDKAALRLERAAHDLVEVGTNGETRSTDAGRRLEAFREAQWHLSVTLRSKATKNHRDHLGDKREKTWLVTDFITMGSPLASVDLLAQPGGAPKQSAERSWFELKLAAREYPSCPPLPQISAAVDPIIMSSPYPLRYPRGAKHDELKRRRHLHHAAAFGPTRWTNVYFENDIVGGPVAAQLGRGVLDIELEVAPPTPRNFAALFSHTSYWAEPSIHALKPAAAKSRDILRDLVKLSPGVDPFELVEVSNVHDRVWSSSSSAQRATMDRLARLKSERSAVIGRRAEEWSTMLEILRHSGTEDRHDLQEWLEVIGGLPDSRCFAAVISGEIVFYRLRDGDLDMSECRTVEIRSTSGRRRCRVLGTESSWPGQLTRRKLHDLQSWIDDFLAV